MKKFLEGKGHMVLAVFILTIYLSPNIFFPEETRLLVHDNLDSIVVWYKNLANSTVLFGANSEKVEFTLNGLERGVFASEYNFMMLLYYLFPPMAAYQLNIVFQCLIAFIGMYLFSKSYIFEGDNNAKNLIVLISLGYALLPYWPGGGVGVAGVPLLTYALLNIFNGRQNWLNWVWVCFYPFYSSLVFSGLFVVIFLFFFILYKMLQNKRFNYQVIIAFIVITVLYVLIENRLFSYVLLQGYESGRLEAASKVYNYKGVIGIAFQTLVFSQYHFHAVAFPVIFSLVISAILFYRKERLKITKLLLINYLLVVASILFYWDKLSFLSQNKIISSLQFRWIALNPFIWYWLFALSAKGWIHKQKFHLYTIYVVGFINIFILMFYVGSKKFYGSEFAENAFYHTYLGGENENVKTFSEFYWIEEFNKIKNLIPLKTKVACLGILPEVAQYNGYYTLGGYYPVYGKAHEALVLDVLGNEKKKMNISVMGVRCYLTCKELASGSAEINNLEFNFDKLKELGYLFLLSDRVINNKQLKLVRTKSNKVFSYEIM